MHASAPLEEVVASGPEAAPPPDPFERRAAEEEDEDEAFPFAEAPHDLQGARTLALPHPVLSQLVGPVRPGEVVLLGGAPDLLNAYAHAFLVEAVRERPEGGAGKLPLGRDPRAVVVDGGNCVSPYLFAACARGVGEDPELLTSRVRLARAFTAYQLVALLTDALDAELETRPSDLLAVLSVRELFEDQDLASSEARQLARGACAGLKRLASRHRVPCVVTSPAPAPEPRALAIERIAKECASRVVGDLHFASVPGARGAGPQPVAAFETADRRVEGGQRALDAWGEMPARPRIAGASAARAEGGISIRTHWRPARASEGA